MTVAPPTRETSWRLAIDFGTVFTVAAIARGDSSTLVDVEGNGTNRLHSGVLLDADGALVVGVAARHQADFNPERYEPTPKRSIGEGSIFLGDRTVPVVDVVAAVLSRVAAEARRAAGGSAPTEVVLTHPAGWAATRLAVLTKASHKAGLGEAVLLPEPVGAAVHIVAATAAIGRHVAIYDFGGGTLDAAVLRRTADGFAVAGPPGGRDPLGGEDIDQRIIDHLGRGPLGEQPDWKLLLAPPDLHWRRAATGLREAVQGAKEGLSTTAAWQIWVPGIDRDAQLTRAELDVLIRPDVDATVDTLLATMAAASVAPADLEGVYLVGGSSRIPLIAQTIWHRLGLEPHTYDDPKAVVALGAAEWRRAAPQPIAAPAAPLPPPPFVPAPAPAPTAAMFPVAPAVPTATSRAGTRRAGGAGGPPTWLRTVAIAAVAAAVIALVVGGVVLTRGSSGSPPAATATPVASLSSSQLAQVLPSAQDVGSGYTKASTTAQALSTLLVCGTAPHITGLVAESAALYTSSAATVFVDATQFSSGHAAAYVSGESTTLGACSGSWTITDPNSGQQVQVDAKQPDGAHIGAQTLRISADFTDSSGTTLYYQDITAASVNDAVVLVVIQQATDDPTRADALASAAIDNLRRAAYSATGS
ncbi:MAG: Hsp70 family protein [Candidatus Dormibacteraeota bacterium]|uniref:Hsp70 family protein n=1 Tax=Candidatus Amunia macphersoniae TaxID=3127014 RepID=A0A934KT60_9BACT|nr:Hsp70 family protein [Candidatus Dormibacteraeota bacterium]